MKKDVGEVLRRRFFTAESLKDREIFRQHVVAALKGIAAVDEQTAKQGAEAEERFLKSFPFILTLPKYSIRNGHNSIDFNEPAGY